MDADFEARLLAADVAFTERDARLLRRVDETNSLNRAAGALGRSYSRAHGRVETLEGAFGPLVERQRGGPGGGGSSLTDRARELLAQFDRLRAGYDSVADTTEAILEGTVEDRTGELGTVTTRAGEVRAFVPPEGTAVQVSVRADAVTLHRPDGGLAERETSALNRFEGRVEAVERGEAVSKVTVDVGAEEPLFALVTEDSRRRLGLDVGTRVVTAFKATATYATPSPGGGGTDDERSASRD